MAEGTIVDGNEEFSDMLEQQTEIEALRGRLYPAILSQPRPLCF